MPPVLRLVTRNSENTGSSPRFSTFSFCSRPNSVLGLQSLPAGRSDVLVSVPERQTHTIATNAVCDPVRRSCWKSGLSSLRALHRPRPPQYTAQRKLHVVLDFGQLLRQQ